MLNLIRNTVSNFRNSAATQSANNFLAAAGITGPTQSKAITQLVADLYASGLWSKMKAVYPMVTDNYNLLSYTEDFSNASWTKTSVTVTANTTTAPNGTLTADSFNDGVANSLHQVYAQINSLPIGTYTFSFYYKSNTSTKNVAIYPFATSTTGGTGTGGVILTQNGTFVANVGSGVVSYGSQDVGNGWRRFYVVGTSTAISNAYPVIAFADGSNITYTGSNTDAYIWGAQLELGNTATTYQPILTTPSAFMASQMKYNLKDARDLDAAFRLTWSGGWTYSATGATPNGTNAYADTKLVPNTSFSANNSSFSFYSRTENTNSGDVMGTATVSSNRCFMYIRYGANQSQINHNSGSALIPTALTSLGIFLSSRTSLGHRYFVNNALSASNSALETGLSTVSFYIGADNTNGSATAYTNRQVAFSHIGDGLTDQDSLLLNQIVEKYQVALSRGVQAAQSFYYNSAYSNEANTYLYSTQITGTTQVSAINTLINGLKANNLWSKMKAVYPFVTDKYNLLSYTEDFSNAYWLKQNATVTTNSITAPNGTLTADTLIDNTTNGFHYIPTTIFAFGQNGNNTVSIYAKANTLNWLSAYVYDGTTAFFTYFNLSNGTIGTNASGNTATIVDAGNGWYRCSITRNYNATAASSNCGFMTANADGVNSYSGTGKSIYLWGAQFEIGSNVSTYQPVLGANNYSTDVAAQMKFNLVNPQDSDAAFRLAFSGGWTYSTNGAQPNGTNGYADTKLIPSTSLSTSSSHLSFYSRTNSPSGSYTGYDIARTHYALITQFGGNKFYANLETAGGYNGVYTSTNGLGHFIASRINNTTTQGFKNGSKVIDVTQVSTLATNTLLISFNGASNYSDKQTAFVSIGDGLTDAEALILYNLIQQYQTTLSRQV